MEKRKIGCIGCVLIMLLVLLSPLNVSATQSRTENFNKAFNLSGNQANDICSVALAQYQRTGAMFGYTEGWCADFVSDCAILAGASSAIPATGGVSYLKQNILNAGGPQNYPCSVPAPFQTCLPLTYFGIFSNYPSDTGYPAVYTIFQISS